MRHGGRYNNHHNLKLVVSLNVVLMQKHGTKLMKARGTPQASVISSVRLSQKQATKVSYCFSIYIQTQLNSSLES